MVNAIREAENNLIAYRARNLVKAAKHPGETNVQFIRRRKQRNRWLAVSAVVILTAATVAAKSCVQ